MSLKALIDADPLCYRIAFACKDETPLHTCHTMDKFVSGVILNVDHDNRWYDKWKLFLSDSTENNFRTKIAVTAPYKGTRGNKPLHLPMLRNHLMKNWNAMLCEGQEADDQIAIEATADEDTIMVTVDKDFDQIPGWHYNNIQRRHYYVNKDEGLRFFYQQILTGDDVDNIIGVHGVGPVKASKMLSDATTERELYDTCVAAYEGSEARVIENARLLWLRRIPNQLWEPPK